MDKQKRYYIDMDGVIADFNAVPNAVERFEKEEKFFYNLQPILLNLLAVHDLIEEGHKVSILSISPNEKADFDKFLWLKKYLPNIKDEDIIILRKGQSKIDFVHNIKQAVLFDDYGKNCKEFELAGGQAIKVTKRDQLLEFFN